MKDVILFRAVMFQFTLPCSVNTILCVVDPADKVCKKILILFLNQFMSYLLYQCRSYYNSFYIVNLYLLHRTNLKNQKKQNVCKQVAVMRGRIF